MKKLLIITSLITSIATSSALAKTEGNYVSGNIQYNKVNLTQQQDGSLPNQRKEDAVGFSVGYKHAFNGWQDMPGRT